MSVTVCRCSFGLWSSRRQIEKIIHLPWTCHDVYNDELMSFWRPHTAKLIVKLVLLLVEHIPAIFPTLAPRALGGTRGNREHDNERVRGRVDVFLKVRCIELKKKSFVELFSWIGTSVCSSSTYLIQD